MSGGTGYYATNILATIEQLERRVATLEKALGRSRSGFRLAANMSADTPMAALPPLSAIPDLLFVEQEENGLYRLEVVKIGGHTWLRPVYVGGARGEEE